MVPYSDIALFYRHNYAKVFKQALHKSKCNYHDAQDLVQDAFVRLLAPRGSLAHMVLPQAAYRAVERAASANYMRRATAHKLNLLYPIKEPVVEAWHPWSPEELRQGAAQLRATHYRQYKLSDEQWRELLTERATLSQSQIHDWYIKRFPTKHPVAAKRAVARARTRLEKLGLWPC